MAIVETYKGYQIEEGPTGGYYDNNNNLVGQTSAYSYIKPDGSRSQFTQSTLAEARRKIDEEISPRPHNQHPSYGND